MGTAGPGNIVHIDNLYVKTFDVKEDEILRLGEISVYDDTSDALITLNDDGVVADTVIVNAQTFRPVQNGEDADNRLATDEILKKSQIECITIGSDWEGKMEADILPGQSVGIKRVDAAVGGFRFAATVVANEVVGIYKHKTFSTVAKKSVLDDSGIVSTGVHT